MANALPNPTSKDDDYILAAFGVAFDVIDATFEALGASNGLKAIKVALGLEPYERTGSYAAHRDRIQEVMRKYQDAFRPNGIG
jgi:hypothetical protein